MSKSCIDCEYWERDTPEREVNTPSVHFPNSPYWKEWWGFCKPLQHLLPFPFRRNWGVYKTEHTDGGEACPGFKLKDT